MTLCRARKIRRSSSSTQRERVGALGAGVSALPVALRAALPFLVQAGHVALHRRLQTGVSARGGNSFELAPRIQDSAQVASPTPGDLTTTRRVPMVQPAGVKPVEAPALGSRAVSHTGR